MNLEEKFRVFVLSRPSNESIDQLPSKQFKDKKADYLLDNRMIVAEVKFLKEDRSVLVDTKLNEMANADPTFPQFFGTVPVESIISKHKNTDGFRTWLCNYTARTLDQIIREAHHQIQDTKKSLSLETSIGLLVLLNEQVELYDEAFVYQEVSRILDRKKDGKYERGSVEAVWFINEYRGNDKRTYSSIMIGPSIKHSNPQPLLNMLHMDWASFNGYALVETNP